MGESMSATDVFNELAHEIDERYRRGERPSLDEYIDRYPELEEEIRELFLTMVVMEQVGIEADRPPTSQAEQPRFVGPLPDRLGGYRILGELGRGGMGVVYKAVQESLGPHVALKVLSHNRPMEPVQSIAGCLAIATSRRFTGWRDSHPVRTVRSRPLPMTAPSPCGRYFADGGARTAGLDRPAIPPHQHRIGQRRQWTARRRRLPFASGPDAHRSGAAEASHLVDAGRRAQRPGDQSGRPLGRDRRSR